MANRQYSVQDALLITLNNVFGAVFGVPAHEREMPEERVSPSELPFAGRQKSARLLRVNHSGEVSAQALYQGQAWIARSLELKTYLIRSAQEENDHLAWCAKRLRDLESRTSYLTPVWYVGSFLIGAVAGAMGDQWSLGFLAETEHQVVQHLEDHLNQLPAQDHKSRAILKHMKVDEAKHATTALQRGGQALPWTVRLLMRGVSKIMIKTAYWV
jgi:ubiquinone biosynthesis monooxygenase Coq7